MASFPLVQSLIDKERSERRAIRRQQDSACRALIDRLKEFLDNPSDQTTYLDVMQPRAALISDVNHRHHNHVAYPTHCPELKDFTTRFNFDHGDIRIRYDDTTRVRVVRPEADIKKNVVYLNLE